mmetsp:Transcript_94490/g.273135  ORF Transcript_94490/g.273135 Transcript_94490/m.273135 type:complete len:201 (+) Transcript_94490:1418-2020(+)
MRIPSVASVFMPRSSWRHRSLGRASSGSRSWRRRPSGTRCWEQPCSISRTVGTSWRFVRFGCARSRTSSHKSGGPQPRCIWRRSCRRSIRCSGHGGEVRASSRPCRRRTSSRAKASNPSAPREVVCPSSSSTSRGASTGLSRASAPCGRASTCVLPTPSARCLSQSKPCPASRFESKYRGSRTSRCSRMANATTCSSARP